MQNLNFSGGLRVSIDSKNRGRGSFGSKGSSILGNHPENTMDERFLNEH